MDLTLNGCSYRRLSSRVNQEVGRGQWNERLWRRSREGDAAGKCPNLTQHRQRSDKRLFNVDRLGGVLLSEPRQQCVTEFSLTRKSVVLGNRLQGTLDDSAKVIRNGHMRVGGLCGRKGRLSWL